MDAGQFLRELWGDPPPGHVLVWMLPQKRSTWYFKLDGVAAQLEGYADRDIYTGVGIAAPDAKLTSATRVTSANVAGIPGLWADIDVAGLGHKKPNLPETVEEAQEVLKELSHAPTILVHSGHGLQAWWLFSSPWMFQSEEERYQAQALARWWHGKLAALFEERGWTVDATHDLARVMRLPGTYNNKAERVPVRVLSSDGPRVSRQELLDLVPMTQEKVVEQICMPLVGEIVLSEDAEPPVLKLLSLMENDQKFKRSWEHRRPDFHDQSASIYDQSLASIAIGADWNDQEVANLMIAHRRKYGADLKLREDYYRRTIRKAKEPMAEHQAEYQAQERLSEALASDSEDKREVLLEGLSELFGVEIRRIVKYRGDPPIYLLSTAQGDITLGPVAKIISQSSFRSAVAAATGRLPPKCTEALWNKRAQAILNACEEAELGEASDPVTETWAWLEGYLSERAVLDDVNEAAAGRLPFTKDGSTYIFADDFRRWVEFNANFRVTPHVMGQRLQRSGAVPKVVKVTAGGRPTTRYCWSFREIP